MVVPHGPKNKSENKNSLLPLNDFINVAPDLIESKQLLQEWISINDIYELQEIYAASTQVVRRIILANSADLSDISDFSIRHLLQEDTLASANHVSAIDLSSTTPPKSLKYHHAPPVNDKAIWYMAYEEEYYGLHNKTKTCTYILEEEYQQLKPPVGNALPTISLATIKTDANGKPLRPNTVYVFLVPLTPPTGHAARYLLRSFPRSNYAYSSPSMFIKYAK